jgi:hypothetical protein
MKPSIKLINQLVSFLEYYSEFPVTFNPLSVSNMIDMFERKEGLK